MKNFYYFSKQKLQYIEIKNFKKKLVAYFTLTTILFSSIIFTGYYFIDNAVNPSNDIISLKNENKVLKAKVSDIVKLYNSLNEQLDSLSFLNDDLRIAVNLEPVSSEERMVGVGGGYFDNTVDFFNNEIDVQLQDAFSYIDEVSRKINFEKAQYDEISKKLEENKKLYQCLPAVKPCAGYLTAHGFGMRNHPILNVRRMHQGIDIVTSKGTPVHAPGDGVVSFVGYNGGYGLCVEITHGFGYRTLYAHLSKVNVKRGKHLKRGDVFAKTGNTGLSTGPHLHYEVSHKGVKHNPEKFFFDDISLFE